MLSAGKLMIVLTTVVKLAQHTFEAWFSIFDLMQECHELEVVSI